MFHASLRGKHADTGGPDAPPRGVVDRFVWGTARSGFDRPIGGRAAENRAIPSGVAVNVDHRRRRRSRSAVSSGVSKVRALSWRRLGGPVSVVAVGAAVVAAVAEATAATVVGAVVSGPTATLVAVLAALLLATRQILRPAIG